MINFEQNMELAKAILEEAESVVALVTWTKQPEPPGCTSYFGTAPGKDTWNFVLVKFPQGYIGAEGYDGTVTKNGTIVRTPRDVAEKMYKLAESSLEKQG